MRRSLETVRISASVPDRPRAKQRLRSAPLVLKPLLRYGLFWIDAQLLRVDQAHTDHVAKLLGKNLKLLRSCQAPILGLARRSEMRLGQLANFFGQLEQSPLSGPINTVDTGVLGGHLLYANSHVVEVHHSTLQDWEHTYGRGRHLCHKRSEATRNVPRSEVLRSLSFR